MKKIIIFLLILIPVLANAQNVPSGIPLKPINNSKVSVIENMLVVWGKVYSEDSLISPKARIDNLKSTSVTNAINTAKNELQSQLNNKLDKTGKAANSELFAGKDSSYYKNNWGSGSLTLTDDVFKFSTNKYTTYSAKSTNTTNFYRSTETPDVPSAGILPFVLNYAHFVAPAVRTPSLLIYSSNMNTPSDTFNASKLTVGSRAVQLTASGSILNHTGSVNDTNYIARFQRQGADRFKFRRNGNLDITGQYLVNGVPITLGGTWGNITGTLADQTDLNTKFNSYVLTTTYNTGLNSKENTITAGTTSQYYRGDKTWQTLPVYTSSKGITKVGNDFQLGGTIGSDVLFSGAYGYVFGNGTASNMASRFSIYQRNTSTGKTSQFHLWNDGDISMSGSSITSSKINYSANFGASLTDLSLTHKRYVDSLVSASNTPTLPTNTTSNDVLWGISPTGQTVLYEVDSLYQGFVPNGTGYLKANGTTVTYENVDFQPLISSGTTSQYYRGDKTWQTLNSSAVGLGNVNNTSDANKPISTATQTALNLKENSLGNPSVDGYLLTSTAAGVRSWIPAPAGLAHDAVTIGTSNGLTLAGQQLSLGLSSPTTNGALSSAKYTEFNNKVSFPGFGSTSTTAATGDHGHSNYIPYYSGSTNPTGTTRYNVNGYLYSTRNFTQYVLSNDGNSYLSLGSGGVSLVAASGQISLSSTSMVTNVPIANDQVGEYAGKFITANLTNSNIYAWVKINEVKAFIDNKGRYNTQAGTSTVYAVSGGVLKDFYTDASTSGTTETDLYSYTIPANVLANDGDKIEAEFILTPYDINNAIGTVKGYFAGTEIGNFSWSSIHKIKIIIIRTGSTTARCVLEEQTSSNVDYIELTSKNWATINIFKITGTASSGGITAKLGTIKYYPVAIN